MADYFDLEAGSGSSNKKYYDYCFTYNNYTEEVENGLRTFADTECTYLTYQREIAPETGTHHLQGFFRFKSRRSFLAIKRVLSTLGCPGISLRVRRGTVDQAIDYCHKEESRNPDNPEIVEYGRRPPGSGARSDLRAVVSRIEQGASLRELVIEAPEAFIRYSRGLERVRFILQRPRRHKTEIYWYYGSTGTGKSRLASDEAGDEAYWKPGASRWWDGYENQPNVIIDDYRCDMCPFHVLLKLFDRYPCIVETKGGSVHFNSRKIWVTAPSRPEVMWSGRCDEDIQQLLRRIEVVREFGTPPPAHAPTFNPPNA